MLSGSLLTLSERQLQGISCVCQHGLKVSKGKAVIVHVQEQGNSDSVLDDIACMLGCTRSSLNGANFPTPLLLVCHHLL